MGRPPIQIDWDEFFKLVSYQCTPKEICDWFDCSWDAMNSRCIDAFGEGFKEVRNKKRSLGRIKLRKMQMDIVERGGPGAATLAIYLDKKMFPEERFDFPPLPPAPPIDVNAVPTCLTFEQFCEKASYPPPYPKQIEMKEFGVNEIDARLLLGSRGYGKTDYVVIAGVTYEIYKEWVLGNELSETTLLITKSREKNTAILGEMSHCLIANGVPLEKDNAHSIRVQGLRGKDHSVSAVTIKTKSLRGRHPKRIIMDDPVTEDDTSEATRSHVDKIYNECFKLSSNILVIGQPAHKHDLYASKRKLIKLLEVAYGEIPELDHDLEAQRLAGVDEKSIQASYYLKIISDGTTPFDKIRYLDKFPTGNSAVAFIDPSHEGGDYTALTILKAHMDGIAVYGKVWKMAWNHCLDEMVPHLKACNVQKLGFETNGLGSQPIVMLRELLPNIGVVGIRSNTNKHSRIMAAGSYAHLIHLSKESDKTYTDHVVQYEYKSKFDDAPDSLASCLVWIGLIKGKV